MSDNFSDEEAIQHLATIGVTNEEVRDTIQYATSWLRAIASLNNATSSPEAHEVLETIRTTPSDPSTPQKAIEPHWWSAPLESISTVPHQPVHNK